MITTIVLIRCDPKSIPETATRLAGIDGVTEVYSVSGEWDLVAIVRVPSYDDIARVVTEEFVNVPGLERTSERQVRPVDRAVAGHRRVGDELRLREPLQDARSQVADERR